MDCSSRHSRRYSSLYQRDGHYSSHGKSFDKGYACRNYPGVLHGLGRREYSRSPPSAPDHDRQIAGDFYRLSLDNLHAVRMAF